MYEQTPENNTAPQDAPKKQDSLAIPLAIIIAGALVAGAIIFTDSKPTTTAQNSPTIQQLPDDSDNQKAPEEVLKLRANDHVYGNPDAEILVIEYSDAECPFCKRFHTTMKQIMENYGKSGQVAWVYRHFPLDQLHPKARKEAEAMECANELGGNDAFWKFANRLYEITPANNGLDHAKLPEIAQYAGVDVSKFNTCLASGKYASRVEEDFANGVQAGVSATPHSIIWNRKTGKQVPIKGAYPYDNVKILLGTAGVK